MTTLTTLTTTTTLTTPLLAVDQKVLVRLGYDWIPGVIVSIQEHLHADSDLLLPLAGAPLSFILHGNNVFDDFDVTNEEDFPRLPVGDVVPYRVAITTPPEGIVMPRAAAAADAEPQRIASIAAEDKWFIQKLCGYNIIRLASQGRMDEPVWTTALADWFHDEKQQQLLDNNNNNGGEQQAMVNEAAKCLLQWCASLRFPRGAVVVADLMSVPLTPMVGLDLWRLFIAGEALERHTLRVLPETLQDLDELLPVYSRQQEWTSLSEWLDTECGSSSKKDRGYFFAKHFADENKSRHAEHVAAIHGDVMMLSWLLQGQFAYCRLASNRPQPRNHERIQRELFPVMAAAQEEHNQQSQQHYKKRYSNLQKLAFFPRDDDGWTPLHHAAAGGHGHFINAYRLGHARSWSHRKPFWFPGVDEFHAKTLHGETALDLAANDATRESLLKLEKGLYQDLLPRTIRTGHLPNEITDFAHLESLVAEYGLEDNEAEMEIENGPFHRDGMTIALEGGNLGHVQFLVRLRDVKDVKTWRNTDGQGMLHVAAGRSSNWRSHVQMEDSHLRISAERRTDHAQRQEAKVLFMEHYWNHGNAAFYREAETYTQGQICPFHLCVEEYAKQCQETAEPRRIQLVQWLIQQGVTLPKYSFIIHNCNFAIAKLLLEYRLKTERYIKEQFGDTAPLAMVSVKQFLYNDAKDASMTPSDIALLCIQRPAYDKRLCITDACRLLLLDWLDSQQYVDLVKVRTSSGESILHEAVSNKETVLAVWLSRKFPQLAHTRSTASGQLPVHVALDRVANEDDCVEKAICKFMIQYAGEGRGSMAWCKDQRPWALQDSNGRTVTNYAMSCCFEDVRKEAQSSGRQNAYRQMLEMVLDEASSVPSFEAHVERNNLEDYACSHHDEMRFIHSCISLGRLDVLQWYEHAFYDNGADSPLNQGLGRHLSTGSESNICKWLPRVFCAPSETFSVGDCLEVLGSRRTKKGGMSLDGSWVVYGWDLFSNRTHTVKIENGVCRSEGYQVPGLEGATLRECDGTSSQGGIRLLLHTNEKGEYWYTTHVNQSIEGAVGMICLKRKASRDSDGYEVWADNGRQIVLTKIETATGDASKGFIWQTASVVASDSQDITIEFDEADPPIQETLPQDSSRINRTGSYKLAHLCGPSAMLNFLGRTLNTGLALARRYGHANIFQWIEEGATRAMLESDLYPKESEFLKLFFSNAPTQDLNQVIHEALMIASPNDLSDKAALVVSHLQDQYYVLGHCWMSQNHLQLHGNAGGYNFSDHNRLGLFRCAARMGRLDRVEWLIAHGFDPNSDVAMTALFDAAYGNHAHVMEALLAKGVDATRPHAFSASGGGIAKRQTILGLAVEMLSGDAVSFLIGNGHVPSDQKLLRHTVGNAFLRPSEVSMKNRIAADRLCIIKELVSAGLSLADSASELMTHALRSWDYVLKEETGTRSKGCDWVPITRELICWLCAHGCNLSSALFALNREHLIFVDGLPDMLADLVQLSETVWPIADAVSRGEPIDEVGRLVHQSGSSIHTIRDPLGRSLVQVAVLSDQAGHLEWLVTEKGANLDEKDADGLTLLDLARQNGLQNVVNTITRLRRLQQPAT